MTKSHWSVLIAGAIAIGLLLLDIPKDIRFFVIISIPIVLYWGNKKDDDKDDYQI